jgi:ATP-dependent Clp protease protease subunit
MIEIKGVIGDEYTYVTWLAALQQEQGPTLEVNINSPGGVVSDGLAIFVDLVEAAAAGRHVITRAVGECASIASIIFVGGTERVVSCPLMIHNPWTVTMGDANEMERMTKELRAVEKQLEDIYADRTGLPRDKISALMDVETWITPPEAVALRFATAVEAVATSANNRLKQFNIEQMEVKKTVAERLLAFLGGKKKDEAGGGGTPRALELTTLDGQTLVVEREEGEPQVGDKASPDGTFQVSETRTIVVADGVITEINDTADPAVPGEEATEALLDEIDRLNAEVARLTALARTPEDVRVLNAVRVAGGIEKLVEKAGIRSTYVPARRVTRETTPAGSGITRDRIAAEREKLNAKK